MIYKKLSLLILFFATGLLTASAQKSPQDMDRFIDALMKKMTTEEKIGQLNLPVTGEITTGQAKSSDIAGKIKKGVPPVSQQRPETPERTPPEG